MDYLKKAKLFRTKKQLGQNFLVDESVIQTIVDNACLSSDDIVLEIGAGLGFVTERLARIAKRVIAVEIDFDAIEELISLPYSNIDVIGKDILTVDISTLVDEPVKIVANIPYYITSPILVHLLGEIDQPDYKNRRHIKEIMLMVQYEVARRIVATEKSPSKEYGLLSILTNYWSEPEFIAKVPAKCFYPAPKVDSAIVKLKIREKPLIDIDNTKLFRRVIQACFNVRRKTIKNSLINSGFSAAIAIDALEKAGINPVRRGETLSMEEFKNLTLAIEPLIQGK